MSEPRDDLSVADLERVLAACRAELDLPPVPDVAARLRRQLAERAPEFAAIGPATTPVLGPNGVLREFALTSQEPAHPTSPRSRRRLLLREAGKLAAALLVFALVARVLDAAWGGGGQGAQRVPPIYHIPPPYGSPEPAPFDQILVSLDPRGGQNYRLFGIGADGSGAEPRQFTQNTATAGEGDAVWSPDGSKVAYFEQVAGLWQDTDVPLVIADAEGNELRRIAATAVWVAWSPDS